MCKDCGDGITMNEAILPKMKSHYSKFRLTIERVILYDDDGNEKDTEYYYGNVALVTRKSSPFITIISSAHGYVEGFVYEELMRDYNEWREDNEY